jgi:hypothetical protein
MVDTPAENYHTTLPERGGIAQFPIIHLAPPGALRIPPAMKADWKGVRFEIKSDPPREPDLWLSLPRGDLSFAPVKFDVLKFAQLCAKIGHGFAVANFGLAGFDHWLPPYILGTNSGLSYVVGSSHEAQRTDSVAAALNWSVHGAQPSSLLVISIHLFPAMGQPPISVVAGTVSEAQLDQILTRPHARLQPSSKPAGRPSGL